MKVLITGCNGQLGQSLVGRLSDKVELLAVDKESLDITDKKAVFNLTSTFLPDYIINAAAYTAVDKAEQEVELSFAINRDGPKYLAEAAEKYGAVMFHISTDYVFDGRAQSPYVEEDKAAPRCVYGESKLAGEEAVSKACKQHIILRIAWLFGEYGNNFVNTMLRMGASHGALNIVGDQFGGPTYVGDVASTLIQMIEHIELRKESYWGIYHFSGEPYVSWYEFACEIFEQAEKKNILDSKPKLRIVSSREFPTLATRPANSRLDCGKINHQFGVVPSDWKKAIKNIQGYKYTL